MSDYFNDETLVEEQLRLRMNDKTSQKTMDMFSSALSHEPKMMGQPRIICSKHGELHDTESLNIQFALENGDIEEKVYCIRCLSSFLDDLMAKNVLPQVKVLQ